MGNRDINIHCYCYFAGQESIEVLKEKFEILKERLKSDIEAGGTASEQNLLAEIRIDDLYEEKDYNDLEIFIKITGEEEIEAEYEPYCAGNMYEPPSGGYYTTERNDNDIVWEIKTTIEESFKKFNNEQSNAYCLYIDDIDNMSESIENVLSNMEEPSRDWDLERDIYNELKGME